MMRWIVGSSLKFPLLVLAIAGVALVVRLSQVRHMPVDALPEVVPPPVEVWVLARWTVVQRRLAVPGVASVSVWGQRDRQLEVQVDRERMRDRGVSLLQVLETTGNALWVSPLTFVEASTPGSGGFIDTP